MIEVNITDSQKKRAVSLPDGQIYNKSMRGKEANLVGAYGEIIVFDYLISMGLNPHFHHKTTYDIFVNGYTIDVKTKERTVNPKPYYDCTVPAYNHDHQKPDWFFFVSLLKSGSGCDRFDTAWLLGYISYSRLNKESRLWKKGETDPSNNWTATIDCWNVPINKLTTFKHQLT